MAAEVHPGLPGIGKSEHDGGAVRVRSRDVFMGSKSKAPTAKHLFVAAMVTEVHPGLPGIGKSKYDGGAVRAALALTVGSGSWHSRASCSADGQNCSARRCLNRERALRFSEPMALANAVPLAVLMELGRSD